MKKTVIEKFSVSILGRYLGTRDGTELRERRNTEITRERVKGEKAGGEYVSA